MNKNLYSIIWGWLKLVVSISLGFLGLWLLTRNVDYSLLGQSFQQVRWGYVLLAVGVIVVTALSKAWRWYYLLYPVRSAVSFQAVVVGIVLGQFFNQLLPIARTGDIVRLLSLPVEIPKGQVLGTLVLEKTLDTLILGITFFLILPFVIVPEVVSNPTTLFITVVIVLGLMYLLAFQARWVIQVTQKITSFLPTRIGRWIVKLVSAGLAGLESLKHGRTATILLLHSLWIGFLSILTPYLMILAFDFPLGLAEAAAINLTVLIGSIPSSAPGNIGVFEFLTVLALQQLGLPENASLLSFAFLFHLVVVGPIVIWGTWFIGQLDWPKEILRGGSKLFKTVSS